MKYCQEVDVIDGDMPAKNDDNHIDECIQILDEIASLGCQSHRFVQEEEVEWSDIFVSLRHRISNDVNYGLTKANKNAFY